MQPAAAREGVNQKGGEPLPLLHAPQRQEHRLCESAPQGRCCELAGVAELIFKEGERNSLGLQAESFDRLVQVFGSECAQRGSPVPDPLYCRRPLRCLPLALQQQQQERGRAPQQAPQHMLRPPAEQRGSQLQQAA